MVSIRNICVSVIVLLLSYPAFGAVKFKDMPADHWASKSVYNLVKLGITSGYPDGTFRGNKSITRFETAIFLSKLSDKLGATDAKEMRRELNEIKAEIVELKKTSSVLVMGGDFELNSMYSGLIAQNSQNPEDKGLLANYRLKSSIQKEISPGSGVKVSLDTIDAGYYGGNRNLVRDMLAVEGKVRVNPVDLGGIGELMTAPLNILFTAGPGILQHTDATGIASSENGICYFLPYTGVSLSTKLFDLEVMGKYYANSFTPDSSGKVLTNYLSASLGYESKRLPIVNGFKMLGEVSGYYRGVSLGGAKDLRGRLSLFSKINELVEANATLAFGRFGNSSLMAGLGIKVSNLLASGGSFKLEVSKIGSEFITQDLANDELREAGFDAFTRPLLNGTSNINAVILHPFSDKVMLEAKGAFRLSPDFGFGANKVGSKLTAQIGATYSLASDTYFNAFYRTEQDPTISESNDLTALGLRYQF